MLSEILPGLIGGLIAGSITMLSWLVTDWQRRRDAQRNRRADFIQRQIYELYAPLDVLAKVEDYYRRMRDRACESFPPERRDAVSGIYADEFIVPAQRKIAELLQAKWYLVKDPRPTSFDEVIEHCATALTLYHLCQKGFGFLDHIPAPGMPTKLVTDVEEALEDLRGYHRRLLGES
jgi:hypothetical protein